MLAIETLVATPTGWTTIGDLRCGHEVFDRNGHPCAVVATSEPFGRRPCFVVRSKDGEAVTATEDHPWSASGRTGSPERAHTTADLAMTTGRPRRVIRASPLGLQLPAADLHPDPYVLGVWLGNGDTGRPYFRSVDGRIAERIRSLGYPCRPAKAADLWTITDPADARNPDGSRARQELTRAGVIHRKHVPDRYLRASREQRIALLQGLVDVGCKCAPTGQACLQAKDGNLLRQIAELVYSLGAKPSVHARSTRTGPSNVLQFKMAGASSLPDVATRCRDSRSATTRTVWAEPVASVPVRSIGVDSTDGLFLAGRTLLPTCGDRL